MMTDRVQLLLFDLDERRYAVNLFSVERVVFIVDITPLPSAPDIVLGVVNVGGEIIPVYDLRKRFRLANREIKLCDQLILATTSKQRVALTADRVIGVLDLPGERITTAQKIFSEMEYVKGVIKLEDGLVLIHDLDEFLSPREERALDQALEEAAEPMLRNV